MISHGCGELLFIMIDSKIYKDRIETTLQGKNVLATQHMGKMWKCDGHWINQGCNECKEW